MEREKRVKIRGRNVEMERGIVEEKIIRSKSTHRHEINKAMAFCMTTGVVPFVHELWSFWRKKKRWKSLTKRSVSCYLSYIWKYLPDIFHRLKISLGEYNLEWWLWLDQIQVLMVQMSVSKQGSSIPLPTWTCQALFEWIQPRLQLPIQSSTCFQEEMQCMTAISLYMSWILHDISNDIRDLSVGG